MGHDVIAFKLFDEFKVCFFFFFFFFFWREQKRPRDTENGAKLIFCFGEENSTGKKRSRRDRRNIVKGRSNSH